MLRKDFRQEGAPGAGCPPKPEAIFKRPGFCGCARTGVRAFASFSADAGAGVTCGDKAGRAAGGTKKGTAAAVPFAGALRLFQLCDLHQLRARFLCILSDLFICHIHLLSPLFCPQPFDRCGMSLSLPVARSIAAARACCVAVICCSRAA